MAGKTRTPYDRVRVRARFGQMKIAIVFDNQRRPDTTGFYCLRALRRRHEVTHFLPQDLSRAEPGRYDAYLNIDDGLAYGFPRSLRPSIFWAIDTHIKPERCLNKARDFDHVFCAQRPGAEEMRKRGIPARWCPLAFDPEIHRKHPLPKILDVSFVGNFGKFRYKRFLWEGKKVFKERARLISLLKGRFNLYTGKFFFEDMAVVYSLSRIVFNRSIRKDVNMRVFEALGCGSLLITDQIGPGQDLLFKSGKHLVEYKSRKQLLKAVRYYLAHEPEREKIAAEGRKAAFRKHTYEHRMEYMLSFLRPEIGRHFDFSNTEGGGDLWAFEQKALSQFCRGRGAHIGCGPRKIRPEAIGIDILKGESRADITASGERLPFRDGELDYIVASHNLEHYRDILQVLGEWKRALKKGGVLGVVVPDDRIIDTVALNPEHLQAFTPDLLKEVIRQSGGLTIEVLQEIVDAWSFGCICRKN